MTIKEVRKQLDIKEGSKLRRLWVSVTTWLEINIKSFINKFRKQ